MTKGKRGDARQIVERIERDALSVERVLSRIRRRLLKREKGSIIQ